MRIDRDDEVFLGAETMVLLPDEHAGEGDDENWSADDLAEEELTLHETIRTLLRLHRE